MPISMLQLVDNNWYTAKTLATRSNASGWHKYYYFDSDCLGHRTYQTEEVAYQTKCPVSDISGLVLVYFLEKKEEKNERKMHSIKLSAERSKYVFWISCVVLTLLSIY